jgi:hypothetical protein
MADVSMEREGEAAGGRVAAAHLVCLCCGGASSFAQDVLTWELNRYGRRQTTDDRRHT